MHLEDSKGLVMDKQFLFAIFGGLFCATVLTLLLAEHDRWYQSIWTQRVLLIKALVMFLIACGLAACYVYG